MYASITLALRAAIALLATLSTAAPSRHPEPARVSAKLSEWMVALSQTTVPAGMVTFTITNAGTIPHAFEVEGPGLEKQTRLIQPGKSDSLTVDLKAGMFDVYCPVGKDSHKKLGMDTHLMVVRDAGAATATAVASPAAATAAKAIHVTGGGSVIQILPGPFPFPDSARPILESFGPEHEALEGQIQNGPYSNNVARISGAFVFDAWDLGTAKDSVSGLAEFTTRDGARWKLVLDRVQTTDVPHHPKFGGVIFGLYYHGNTGVHTPLVPTINSAVAAWTIGHLYKDGVLVTDNAYTHVMLLSHTRSANDYRLECWDCSTNAIDELQLQITAAPGEPKFDAPGGFLFVNWETSTARPGK